MSDLILKWSWRYHHLEVTEFDDLTEAAMSSEYGEDAGEEALDHIEVIHDDGTTEQLDRKAVRRITRPITDARDAEYVAAPKPTVKITITSEKSTATLGWYKDAAEAESDYQRLSKRLGDRVRVEPVL